jgi:hypothetical protein
MVEKSAEASTEISRSGPKVLNRSEKIGSCDRELKTALGKKI